MKNHLETSSHSGPLRFESRNTPSMSNRIFKSAKVSGRGHRFPPLVILSPPSSLLPLSSSLEFHPITPSLSPSWSAPTITVSSSESLTMVLSLSPPLPGNHSWKESIKKRESDSVCLFGWDLLALYISIKKKRNQKFISLMS